MADKIKLELQEKDLTAGTNTQKELKDFKKDFEVKLQEAKDKKTLEEAQKLFTDVIFYYDAKDRILQIGDVTMQASSADQWSEWMSKMAADVSSMNVELTNLETQKTADEAKVLQDAKDKEKELAKKVDDNTSTDIDFSQKIKEKSWLSTFLTGKTTLEQAIDDKNDVEGEAFRKQLLEVLKKGKDQYETVLKNGGPATFNKKEWYTLQFIEAHNADLSKKEKKIDWLKLKTDYNHGLDANGQPIEAPVTSAPSTEKTYEQMTDAEKVAKAKEAMEVLKGIQMVQERDPATGRSINVVNVSTEQLSALQSISDMGGADFGYEAVGYEPTRADRRDDRMVDKTQKLMNRGKYSKALKMAEKTNERFTEQRKALQKINAYSQNFANERNRAAYNKNVANNAMNLSRGAGYAGVTMDVIPYAPLFTNICQNVRSLSDRGHLTMDVIGIGPVQVRAPERYNLAFNHAIDGVAGQYGLDGQYALTGQNGVPGRGINQVESLITKYTRMNPEQAKGLTNGLLLGGGAFLLFKGMKWLFTGKTESKPMKDSFWGRLALIGGGLWGANKLSQMGTGMGLTDVLKGLYNGNLTFQDLWKGTYAKYDKNSLEYIAGTNQVYNQAFRNVPYGSILPYVEKGNNGYPEVKDINGLIAQMRIIEGQTADRNKKAAIHSQITFLESLNKDPNGKTILNQAFVNMGVDYKKMSDNKDATADKLSDEITERVKKYQDYLNEKGRKLKGDKTSQDKLLQYTQTGKPTLEDMVKDQCFKKVTSINGRDVADPFVTIGPDGKEIPVDPDTKLDEALKDVDLPLAKQLFFARMQLVERGIDAHFEIVKGTNQMLLSSYQMKTPIQYDNGGWYIGGPSSGNANERLPIRFDNAENALWVANLTNRLIHLNNGKFSSLNKPFSAGGANRDLMVGGSPKMVQRLTDTEAVDSSTSKKYGGELFANQIEGYANYLNGIHNKNGESIWNEKGKLGFDTRAGYIENWMNGIVPLPKRKPEDKFNKGNAPTLTKEEQDKLDKEEAEKKKKEEDEAKKKNTTPNNPNPPKDLKLPNGPDVNDPSKVLNEKAPEFTDEDKKLGDEWYEKYNHKDGGDKAGKNPVERNKTFFYIWAKSFHNNTPYFTVDGYGTIGTLKGKECGIIYERPVGGDYPPRRIKVQTGWYGHKDKVNEKVA